MTQTVYASFVSIEDAERATGALLDHGLKPSDVTLVVHDRFASRLSSYRDLNMKEPIDGEVTPNLSEAKHGITTTTAEDATVGAVAGAGVGLGVGILAGLVAIFVPGIGPVVGGGALAIAAAGAAATTGAGAIAGGVMGFLKDMGVPDEMVTHYYETYQTGGAILAIDLDGALSRTEVDNVLHKYNAQNIGEYSKVSRAEVM